eukprot:2620158-Rhodomonas_salina.1
MHEEGDGCTDAGACAVKDLTSISLSSTAKPAAPIAGPGQPILPAYARPMLSAYARPTLYP